MFGTPVGHFHGADDPTAGALRGFLLLAGLVVCSEAVRGALPRLGRSHVDHIMDGLVLCWGRPRDGLILFLRRRAPRDTSMAQMRRARLLLGVVVCSRTGHPRGTCAHPTHSHLLPSPKNKVCSTRRPTPALPTQNKPPPCLPSTHPPPPKPGALPLPPSFLPPIPPHPRSKSSGPAARSPTYNRWACAPTS